MGCERRDDGGAGGGGPRLCKIIRSAARLCWSKLHRQKRYCYVDKSGSQGELRARQEPSCWMAKRESRVGDAATHDGMESVLRQEKKTSKARRARGEKGAINCTARIHTLD